MATAENARDGAMLAPMLRAVYGHHRLHGRVLLYTTSARTQSDEESALAHWMRENPDDLADFAPTGYTSEDVPFLEMPLAS